MPDPRFAGGLAFALFAGTGLVTLANSCADPAVDASATAPITLAPAPPAPQENDARLTEFRQPLHDPIRPYILGLDRTHATICWVTTKERIGKVRLLAYDAATEHSESGPASHYHKVEITGLQPGTTYRYEIGLNYRGEFTTADSSPGFEVAVFGHPGGTETPLEYPSELLHGRFMALSPELVLCTGDIVQRATMRNFRSSFFHRFGGYMRSKPIYVSPANHDGQWNGRNYDEFRKLFPHQFGPETGGSYWFDYKHVRFFALTYKLPTPELFREHVEWLANAIDESDQELHIVFLGGHDKKWYDQDLLFKTLSERRVDMVLGGDGGAVYQKKLHGVDYFFAGDGGVGAYPFYHLRFYDYHFNVHLHHADASRKSRTYRSFYSSKNKPALLALDDKRKATEQYYVHFTGIDLPSTKVGGLSLELDWPYDVDSELQVEWKPKGPGSFTREQNHFVKAKSKTTMRIEIPQLHRQLSPGKPYILDELILRLPPYRVKNYRDYPLQRLVTNAYLFPEE